MLNTARCSCLKGKLACTTSHRRCSSLLVGTVRVFLRSISVLECQSDLPRAWIFLALPSLGRSQSPFFQYKRSIGTCGVQKSGNVLHSKGGTLEHNVPDQTNVQTAPSTGNVVKSPDVSNAFGSIMTHTHRYIYINIYLCVRAYCTLHLCHLLLGTVSGERHEKVLYGNQALIICEDLQ